MSDEEAAQEALKLWGSNGYVRRVETFKLGQTTVSFEVGKRGRDRLGRGRTCLGRGPSWAAAFAAVAKHRGPNQTVLWSHA